MKVEISECQQNGVIHTENDGLCPRLKKKHNFIINYVHAFLICAVVAASNFVLNRSRFFLTGQGRRLTMIARMRKKTFIALIILILLRAFYWVRY